MDLRTKAAETLLNRREARRHILDFTLYTKPDYQVSWHHEVLCDAVDAFAAKKLKRLIISIPPQNGKTEIASRRFPAFKLGQDPDTKIIACSYSADLAFSNNRDVQMIIDSPAYHSLFPNTRLNSSNVRTTSQGSYRRTSDIFDIVGHKGVYRAAGVGGGITGLGMDFGIIDDPYKNREEAESPTIRKKVYDWYTDVFYTRQGKDASILLIMTRWHKGDLVGQLTNFEQNNEYGDDWEVITLPALSEETLSPYDRRTGPDQPLWPEKYSLEFLLKTKNLVPVYTWLSLYQQRPVAISGNLVNEADFKFCSLDTSIFNSHTLHSAVLVLSETIKYTLGQCRLFQTCDPAASVKDSADFFALGTWAQTPHNELALIDLVHTRMEKPQQLHLMKQQYNSWHPVTQWIATKGLGISLYQDLRANGLPVNKVEEETDKVSRFITACNKISTGDFYILDRLPHKTEYITELLDFPNGEHDDLVDITSTAAHVILQMPFEIQAYETSFVGAFSSGGMRI